MTLAAETQAKPIARPAESGRGKIVLQSVDDKTVATTFSATSPLKLLSPKARSSAAWIFTSTFGGGLLGGDSIALEIDCAPDTRLLLSTQASTKIYRSTGAISRQSTQVRLDDHAIAVVAPDPIVCFAGSRFEQHQRFDLHSRAGLVLIDSLTSGRRARGERWAFDRYASRTEIFVDERCIFRDAIVLDPTDGRLDAAMRMGSIDCFATVIVTGPPFADATKSLLEIARASPIESEVRFAASPIEGGVVIRVAGCETETLVRWIRDRLAFVTEILGEDPWLRKF